MDELFGIVVQDAVIETIISEKEFMDAINAEQLGYTVQDPVMDLSVVEDQLECVAPDLMFFFASTTGQYSVTLTFSIEENREITIYWGDGEADTIVGIGYDADWEANWPSAQPDQQYNVIASHTYGSIAEYHIHIDEVKYIHTCNAALQHLYGDISHWANAFERLALVRLGSNSFTGDITDWYWENMVSVVVPNNNLSGDITNHYLWPKITNYYVATNPLLTGDVTNWKNALTLRAILFNACPNIVGDLTDWSEMVQSPYIQSVYVNGAGVTYDLSNWNFPKAWYLYLYGSTNFTGDISVFRVSTELIRLYGYGCAYTFDSQLPWPNIRVSYGINISNNNWTSQMTDNALIAFAGGPLFNTAINIGGTNAARTSASDAAKATLIANGCTVTVNE